MEISNDDLARILGRMEAKLDAQAHSTVRVESGLVSLDARITARLDNQGARLRELEMVNPKELIVQMKDHDKRLRKLEYGATKDGAIAGLASSIAVAAIVEFLKRVFH